MEQQKPLKSNLKSTDSNNTASRPRNITFSKTVEYSDKPATISLLQSQQMNQLNKAAIAVLLWEKKNSKNGLIINCSTIYARNNLIKSALIEYPDLPSGCLKLIEESFHVHISKEGVEHIINDYKKQFHHSKPALEL